MKKEICFISSLILAACSDSPKFESVETDSDPVGTIHASLSIVVNKTSWCGIKEPFSGIQLVSNDSEGKLVNIYETDANGLLDLPWKDNEQHLTMIIPPEYTDGRNKYTQLKSYLNVTQGHLGTVELFDTELNQQCDCRYLNVDISQLTEQYSQHFIGTNILSRTPQAEYQVSMCKEQDKWPSLMVYVIPFDELERSQVMVREIHDQDFEQDVEIGLDTFNNTALQSQLINVSSNVDVNAYRVLARMMDGKIEQVFSNSQQPSMFTELYENQFVQGLRWQSDSNFSYITGSQLKVNKPENEHHLVFPVSHDPLKLEIENLAQDIKLHGLNVYYDFSHLEHEYDIAEIQLYEADALAWYFDAPISGTLPKLQMPPNIQQIIDELQAIQVSVTVTDYAGIEGIDEVRSKLGAHSEGEGDISIFDEFRYESVRLN